MIAVHETGSASTKSKLYTTAIRKGMTIPIRKHSHFALNVQVVQLLRRATAADVEQYEPNCVLDMVLRAGRH